MQARTTHNQRGFGHVGVILAIVVVLAVGAAGWYVFQKNHKSPTSAADKTLQDAIKNAKCDYNDKDLCKFFTSWKTQNYYTVVSTNESGGEKSTSTVQSEGKDKAHITVSGTTPYETIVIGNVMYTKASNGTWWKQTLPQNQVDKVKNSTATDFKDPGTDTTDTSAKITYKKLGKEKCGQLTCFKYQEIDPSDTKTTTYLWFDDQDYQLRRSQSISEDGSKSDATFDYSKVTVAAPSPVKDLAPNQYLVPGQDEPVTVPDNTDLQNLIDQYQSQQ